MLRMNKLVLVVAWAITCFLFYGVAAHADELDQSTKLTFRQPIQISGHTLPAGAYLFKPGGSVVTLAQPAQDTPAVLLKWFYPGELTGHEFVYPKAQQQQLAQDRQQNIVANAPVGSGD